MITNGLVEGYEPLERLTLEGLRRLWMDLLLVIQPLGIQNVQSECKMIWNMWSHEDGQQTMVKHEGWLFIVGNVNFRRETGYAECLVLIFATNVYYYQAVAKVSLIGFPHIYTASRAKQWHSTRTRYLVADGFLMISKLFPDRSGVGV